VRAEVAQDFFETMHTKPGSSFIHTVNEARVSEGPRTVPVENFVRFLSRWSNTKSIICTNIIWLLMLTFGYDVVVDGRAPSPDE
jgi:hypothetical protein